MGGDEGRALALTQAGLVAGVEAVERGGERGEVGLVVGGVVRVRLGQGGLDGGGGGLHAGRVEPEVRVRGLGGAGGVGVGVGVAVLVLLLDALMVLEVH